MSYNTPKEIAQIFTQAGVIKFRMPVGRFIVLALLGGAFIAFGGLLTVIVAGGMPSVAVANPGLVRLAAGVLFPVGLIMVSVAGADLFTSDCTAMPLPWLQRQIAWTAVLKVLIISYLFNFIGAQFIAYALGSEAGLFTASPYRDYLHRVAEAKVHYSFGAVFLKGIGANWLVCLGTWMGYAAKNVTGKAVGIWIPVMIFVTLGYEHSIANMFFIPAAIYSGAEITWMQFVADNLIPATLGNIVGGVVFVACAYWFVYLKK